MDFRKFSSNCYYFFLKESQTMSLNKNELCAKNNQANCKNRRMVNS